MSLNKPLSKNLRSQLESTVKAARDVAEKAAHAALVHLGVGESEAPSHLTQDQKALRRRLRAHGRQLGDLKHANDTQPIRHLVWEVAYEHWHRMLFARFLAENNLLMWEPGAAVTLAECEEISQDPSINLGAKSSWELAAILAARMLPQVFKPHSPVFELRFSPNEQRDLELLLKELSPETFQASDSLGWVYQFWQAKRKDEVNASEVKIGADEISAVTQLFTEPYMVDFLLHNSLGAWWHNRHPNKTCPVELTYLRKLEDGKPVAGTFEGWPDSLSEFTLLDPCCGSGHFLVAAFLMLVPMRMASEGLSAKSAVDAVLADNLHGLEIDPRCVEIAVFALALTAWRYPDESGNAMGVRSEMPPPNIACCGLKVAAKAEDWEALVPNNASNAVLIKQELRLLHNSFAQAPLLGSLLDPSKTLKNDLASSNSENLNSFLELALSTQSSAQLNVETEDAWDMALAARGLLEAASILQGRYHLVVTNVPYLGRRDQTELLKTFCDNYYEDAKSDLANVFLERCLELSLPLGQGAVQIVMPQNWLFLGSYQKMRKALLKECDWLNIVILGDKAFQTPLGVSPILLSIATGRSSSDLFTAFSVSESQNVADKSLALIDAKIKLLNINKQLENPDSRISLEAISIGLPLLNFAECYQGVITGDKDRFIRQIWEVPSFNKAWEKLSTTNNDQFLYGGMDSILFWQQGSGELHHYARESRDKLHDMHESGNKAWNRVGIKINPQGELRCSPYGGEMFDRSVSVIVPKNNLHLEAIFSFCMSEKFHEEVRKLDKVRYVTNATFLKVPFDLDYWTKVATEKYPSGLPEPYSDNPTQWIFHGHPRFSASPLQVATARLLGYLWPAELDVGIDLSDQARKLIQSCKALEKDIDDDGIVCLRAVRGEKPAHERLLTLLINAWETVEPGSWKTSVLDKLLADAGYAGKGLDIWLQEKFFEQHAKLFQHRPFIWHVWDGLKDGFSALVNYHLLDTQNLERLIHTYLGDWIRSQEAELSKGEDGAVLRLAAAQVLKKKLEAILEGESPYDIFVRWKSLEEQPLGWSPDLNDGVRTNIRPFVEAEVLRYNKKPKFNITWDKDRGKDMNSAPWFKTFNGDRINDHHTTLLEKKTARAKAVLST